MNRYLIYILIALFFVPLCYLYPQAYYGVKGISEGDWGIDEVDSPIDDPATREDSVSLEGESKAIEPINGSRVINATITAFNTVEEQTDDRPCESASGDWICGRTDVVACPPHIPFHTWVEIPMGIDQVFGATIIKRFECLDRTASKYSDRFDISFDKDMEGAINWGIKTLEVKIINN